MLPLASPLTRLTTSPQPTQVRRLCHHAPDLAVRLRLELALGEGGGKVAGAPLAVGLRSREEGGAAATAPCATVSAQPPQLAATQAGGRGPSDTASRPLLGSSWRAAAARLPGKAQPTCVVRSTIHSASFSPSLRPSTEGDWLWK
jgi:hypothetical protein